MAGQGQAIEIIGDIPETDGPDRHCDESHLE